MAASFTQRIKFFFSGQHPQQPARSFAIPFMNVGARRGSREILVAYRDNAWLQSVVNIVAEGVATPRWRAYKRIASGQIVRDYSLQAAPFEQRHKALKALKAESELIEVPNSEVLAVLTNPNPEFTGRACLRLIQQHLDLVGEAFLWLQRSAEGRVVGYIPLPPHTVLQTPTAESPVFRVAYQRVQGSLPAADVLWLRQPDPENPHGRGAGLGLALGDELDTSEHLQKTLKSAFARGGIPAAVVSIDAGDGDSDEAAEDLQKRFEESFKGPDNAGKVWFAPGKANVAAVNVDLKSLETHDLQKALLDYVRQVFRVPPELMGDLTSSNRATAEAAKYHLAEYAISPRLEFLRTELQQKLVPLIDPEVILDFEDPRPQSFERVQALVTNPVTAPAFRMNEVRELAGFEPDPELEGKRLYPMPGQVAPVQALDAAQAQAQSEPAKSEQGPLFANVR